MSGYEESLRGALALLKKHHVIKIFGRIDNDSGGIVIECLGKAHELGIQEVTILINSGGGSSAMGIGIHSTITLFNASGGKTIGLVLSKCSSSASVLFQGCSNRLLMPGSQMLIHWGIAQYNNKEQDAIMSDDPEKYSWVIRQIQDTNNSMIRLYQRRSGLSRDMVIQLCGTEETLYDERIVQLGLADKVVLPSELSLPAQMLITPHSFSSDLLTFV